MDNLTHSLFALTLARTTLSRAGRGTTPALLVASNAPDIDIVAAASGSLNYLRWHRGPTHGPIGIVVLSVVTAAIVRWSYVFYARLKASRSSDSIRGLEREGFSRAASFPMLVAISLIGTVLHVLMDLPTSYGTRLLSPFSWRWFAVDLMPIIDIYLLVTLASGLLLGHRSAAGRQRNASIVLTLMAANYGVRAVAHQQALAAVPELFGPTLPQPCNPAVVPTPIDRWPRSMPASPAPTSRCLVESAAIPTFASPFRWRIITQLSNAYELHDLDLLEQFFRDPSDRSAAPWRTTLRYPNVWTPPVETAARGRLGQVFLGFSRFPAARSVVDRGGATVVRWTDVRFVSGTVSLDQPGPGSDLFTATVRLDTSGRIVQETLGR